MTHGRQQVLVIDPEPWLHVDVTRALRGHDVAVLSASNSELGLQAVEDGFQPDAILIDLTANDSGTARLLRHVKSVHAAWVIAVVPDAHVDRIGPIPDRHLSKPLQVEELIAALEDLCGARRSLFDRECPRLPDSRWIGSVHRREP